MCIIHHSIHLILFQIGKSLLDPSRSSEHEMIRVEEEWDQWLDLQHVDKHDKYVT